MLLVRVFSRSVCLLVILIAINGNTRSKGDCDNDGRNTTDECCTNYYMVNGICQACPPGYFGRHCAVPCPYPSFGVTCGDECQCSVSECSHQFGCLSNGMVTDVSASQTNSSVITYVSGISTENLRNISEMTSPQSSSNSPPENVTSTTVIIVVGGVLSLFLLVIIANQIHGKVSRMKKKRVSREINNQYPDGRNSEEYCVIDDRQVTGPRYQHIETNDSLQFENKNDDLHVPDISPDQPLVPVRPLQKSTTLSSQAEVCLDYYDTGQDENPSSDGSYEKPVNKVDNYAKVIDTKDGEILVFIENSPESSVHQSSDTQNFESELHSSEHLENAPITSHTHQENTYLDVIHK